MRSIYSLLAMLSLGFPLIHAQEVTDESDAPIHHWLVSFVAAKTGVPLTDIEVDAQVAVSGKNEQESRLLKSDNQGHVQIPLREGQATILNVRGNGWCKTAGLPVVGELPPKFFQGDPPPPNLKKHIKIKLYQGTECRGRLLLPNGEPAANVLLTAGVHCRSTPWISQAYLENLNRVTYTTSAWPNWSAKTTTHQDGSFRITVPPANVRSWIRLGITQGGHRPIDTSHLEKHKPSHPLINYAPFSVDINGSQDSLQVDESSRIVHLGDLYLKKGIVLRGRVVDANDQPLSDIHLFTSSPHGPLAGRRTVTRADGNFEFMPMNSGTITLSPDATFRNDQGQKISRDVQAVLLSQEVDLTEDVNPHELIIKALPHLDLEFEWVDRRIKKGPVSYYGSFTLTGIAIQPDGSKTHWRGETVQTLKNGKEILSVKVPESISELQIALHPDQKVTPSYQDETVERAVGQVVLSNIPNPQRRIIYGDEPIKKSR